MKIVSLDFETANYSPVSMCAVGIAVLEGNAAIRSHYWKVRPPKGHGFFIPEWTEEVHGLSWFDVKDAPQFDAIAAEVLPHLRSADLVVAHNAPFDMRVLSATFEHYHLASPDIRYLCTCQLARRVWPQLPDHRLSTIAQHLSIPLQHHHAQSDAEAAAHLVRAAMAQLGVGELEPLFALLDIQPQSLTSTAHE